MKKIFSVMVVALMLALGATRAWSQVQMSLNSATPTGGPAGSGPTYMSLADATLAGGVPMPRHPGPVHSPMPVGMPVVPASYSGAVGCDDCGAEIASCECRSHQRKCIGMWFDAEYLLWWGDKRNVPVLATTSAAGTPQANAGLIGESALFGGHQIGGDEQSGFRVSAGGYLNHQKSVGFGLRYFRIEGDDDGFAADSEGDPILARPYFNESLGIDDRLLVAFPGISRGGIDIETSNETQGWEAYLSKLLFCSRNTRIDVIGGYQHTDVDDEIWVSHSLTSLDPAGLVPVGTTIDSRDRFEVENRFDGGFIGLMTEARDGRLTWKVLTKIAFGNMNQQATVSGSTVTTVPGAGSVTNDYGLLALPSNIGSIERDEFAVVPELNVSVGYRFTKNFNMSAGYNLIYWSQIASAGNVIDTSINPTQIGGPLVGAARPTLSLGEDDGFWYQGLSVGGTVRF